MARSSRRYEAAGIFKHILAMGGEEPTILLPPRPEILLEGGDVIVDNGNIFVGIGGRTNRAGFQYLKETFGEFFNVVPLVCQSTPENPVLHLDCTFNPVGDGYALIYPRGIKQVPNIIAETYTLITIDDDAQRALATNVLSLNPNTVVSRGHPACKTVNDSLEDAGLTVETIPFDGPPATGGSFRCCTLPLVRS
jgi:N-dimethylarginine dimethylaminohydrolase